jgi:hypothetical protein
MLQSNQPPKILIPFANSGTKNTIPTTSQIGITDGAASYPDGFPPLTMTPVSSGGVPPYGADMNGILNAVTLIQRWQSGGGHFQYDATWSSDNAGYPKGAMLLKSTGLGLWFNTVDGNTTNPDASGAGWEDLGMALTGVQTMPQYNNTSAPANTAFVQRAIGNRSTVTGVSANATLDASYSGNTILAFGSGGYTITLPLGSTLTSGVTIEICCTANNVTVAASGTDVIYLQAASPPSSLKLNDGDSIQLEWSPGSSGWLATKKPQSLPPVGISAGATLTGSYVGRTINTFGTGPYTVTLPQGSTVQDGTEIAFFSSASGNVTVARAGTDSIFVNSSSVTSMVMNNGDSLRLKWFASAPGWFAVGGTAQLGYAPQFASSLSTSGYWKSPSGQIIQYGKTGSIAGNTSSSISFPIAFPTAAYAIFTTKDNNDITNEQTFDASSLTTTGATICNTTGVAGACWWWAIGK